MGPNDWMPACSSCGAPMVGGKDGDECAMCRQANAESDD